MILAQCLRQRRGVVHGGQAQLGRNRTQRQQPVGGTKLFGQRGIDGTSLTVNKVEGTRFDVLLIHHSLSVTTWGERQAGDRVNIEIDTMARYAARLAEAAKEGL